MNERINELRNKRSKSSNIDRLIGDKTNIIDKGDISNEMNRFFRSVGRDLAEKLTQFQIPSSQVTMQ